MNEHLLHLEGVSLRFGGLNALTNISFAMKPGEVVALIGPNGAGKTSLFNCLSGFYRPQEGRIGFRGKEVTGLPPHVMARRGLARSFQNIELFANMTCLDNLLLGRHLHVKASLLGAIFSTPGWRRDEVNQRAKAEELMDLLDLQAYRDSRVGALPYGVQKLIEVARALGVAGKESAGAPVVRLARLGFAGVDLGTVSDIGVEQGLQSLRHYRFDVDPESRQFSGRPLHDYHSHAADSFRYFAVSQRSSRGRPFSAGS